MRLDCVRCQGEFESPTILGYCPDCLGFFSGQSRAIADAHNPLPNVHVDGKFAVAKECPRTVYDPVGRRNVCGLCGSEEIEPGYGIGTGFGIGVYNFCLGCNSFLDFSEDTGD